MGNLKSKFDDIIKDGDGHEWSQICLICAVNLQVGKQSEIPSDGYTCGVKGCSNEAVYYIDFN